MNFLNSACMKVGIVAVFIAIAMITYLIYILFSDPSLVEMKPMAYVLIVLIAAAVITRIMWLRAERSS